MRAGDDYYPGDLTPLPTWPGVAPGPRGISNTMSPIYCDLTPFVDIMPKPPVLWIRGADDQIVSDASLLDFGTLGRMGAVPGWPGEAAYPSQPMVSQMRAMMDRYRAKGGRCEEAVSPDCGHSPHSERPQEFQARLAAFLGGA